MYRVAAKRPIKIFVRFQQRDFHPTPRQAQGKHHPAWPSADNAASRFAGWVEVVGLQHFFGNRSSRHGRASETRTRAGAVYAGPKEVFYSPVRRVGCCGWGSTRSEHLSFRHASAASKRRNLLSSQKHLAAAKIGRAS